MTLPVSSFTVPSIVAVVCTRDRSGYKAEAMIHTATIAFMENLPRSVIVELLSNPVDFELFSTGIFPQLGVRFGCNG